MQLQPARPVSPSHRSTGSAAAHVPAALTSPAIQRAFLLHLNAAHDAVWAIIRQFRPDEPEDVWAEVRARAWAKFPAMFAQEQLDLAAGRASKHTWIPWFVTIATNYIIDLHRHQHGKRAPLPASPDTAGDPPTAPSAGNSAAPSPATTHGPRGSDAQPAGSRPTRAPVGCVPLNDESIAMPPGANPEVFAIMREGWRLVNHLIGALPADERDAVKAMLNGVEDAEVADRWCVSTRTIRRRRAQALERLRRHLNAQGYERVVDLIAA